jgi:hypothetical protein
MIKAPVSKRIHVTIPEGTYTKLEVWATSENRPVANLAAYLLQKAIEEAEAEGKIPKPRQTEK